MTFVTASSRSCATRSSSLLVRSLTLLWAVAAALALGSCGGGGSGGPAASAPDSSAAAAGAPPAVAAAANVLPVIVDHGTNGASVNAPYVSVTVCEPGTENCSTIDHVLVDTASNGLRLTSSAALAALSLPAVANAAGTPVGECAQFASGFVWGSVRVADVRLAGERASGVPLQVASDPAPIYATVPTSCSNSNPAGAIDIASTANGILGVGMLTRDCGGLCTRSTAPGVYFACADTGCTGTTLPLTSQVANPVPMFATDNNGVALTLPPVPVGGAATLSGALVFGIDTQANNRLGSATVFTVDAHGNFTTTYNGQSFPDSFIDSGSNALFFSDPNLPRCSGFYCPPAPLTLSAVNTSASNVSGTVDFIVESPSSVGGAAAAHLAGDFDFGASQSFDWGLPFFFGRTVFVATVGASTSLGTGPFWAY
jgi:Protein of unknown function (DUF3443)